MPPPPDTSQTTQSLLIRVLAHIQSGIHPTYPQTPPSPFEYFIRTKYSTILKPLITAKWDEITSEGRDMYGENLGSNRPPRSFSERIIKESFEALSDEERNKLDEELEVGWIISKKRYHQDVMNLYGPCDATALINSMSSILRPVVATLEVMTGLNFSLWAGGPINNGIGLINVISNMKNGNVPLVVPIAEKTSFERAAQAWIDESNSSFLDACMETTTSECAFLSGFFDDDVNELQATQLTPISLEEMSPRVYSDNIATPPGPPQPTCRTSPMSYSGIFTTEEGGDTSQGTPLAPDTNFFDPLRLAAELRSMEAQENIYEQDEIDELEESDELEYIDELEAHTTGPSRSFVTVRPESTPSISETIIGFGNSTPTIQSARHNEIVTLPSNKRKNPFDDSSSTQSVWGAVSPSLPRRSPRNLGSSPNCAAPHTSPSPSSKRRRTFNAGK